MKKKILIGSILAVVLLLLMPSIPAIQTNTIREGVKQDLQEKLDSYSLDEINQFDFLYYAGSGIIDILGEEKVTELTETFSNSYPELYKRLVTTFTNNDDLIDSIQTLNDENGKPLEWEFPIIKGILLFISLIFGFFGCIPLIFIGPSFGIALMFGELYGIIEDLEGGFPIISLLLLVVGGVFYSIFQFFSMITVGFWFISLSLFMIVFDPSFPPIP